MIEPLPSDEVSLRPHPVTGADGVPASEIRIGARQVPQALAGLVLEAAFRVDNRYLLFLSDDVPQEDALRIHLLDQDLALVDSATLSWMYATGSFELLRLMPPRAVSFRFFGATDWVVELLDGPARRLPWLGEPRGVHRRFGFVRHFRVRGSPRAEAAC